MKTTDTAPKDNDKAQADCPSDESRVWAIDNAAKIAAMRIDKQYKARTLRIHYKGKRDPVNGKTSGTTPSAAVEPAHVPNTPADVEDRARQEACAELYMKYGDAVRLKSTVYIHDSGDLAGAVKASRHKIYFLNRAGEWEKKFDHLQDDARGPIGKSEIAALKKCIASLTPDSPALPKGKQFISDR